MLGTDVFVVADNLEGHHRTGVTVVEGNADRLGEGIFRGAESACLPPARPERSRSISPEHATSSMPNEDHRYATEQNRSAARINAERHFRPTTSSSATHVVNGGGRMTNVIVVIGAGQIGQAIARGVGVAKHILLADLRLESANAAAEVMTNAGYELCVATCDLSSRQSVYALVDAATSEPRSPG